MDLSFGWVAVVLVALGVAVIYMVMHARGGGQKPPELVSVVAPTPPRPPVLVVRVPPLAWEPTAALEFMKALLPLTASGPISLRIVATSTQITWEIALPPAAVAAVTRALLAFYPQAELANLENVAPTEPPADTELR